MVSVTIDITYSTQKETTLSSIIRNPKDFWSGVMFLIFGIFTVVVARDYSMGSAGRMGPAYFPTVLGGILALLGAIGVIRSLIKPGEAIEKFALKELGLIVAAVLLFGILMRGAGMLVAIPVLVILSAYASDKFKAGTSIALAIGAAIFCSLVFVKGLGLPMPLLGSWFGF
jgi:hypothetical protein